MININYGRNKKLMEACKPLAEYSWFINEINDNLGKQDKHDIFLAVKTAIDAIPEDYKLREFLMSHTAEVEGMLDTEYNEAEVKELFIEEGRQEGIKEGIKEGSNNKAREIAKKLLKKGNDVASVVEDTGLSEIVLKQLEEEISKESEESK